MAIPMSALRRALAEMAEGAGAGVQRAYGGSHIDSGIAMGGLPGAIAGGAAGAQYDDGNPLTNETGAGVIGGALGGAMLGGGAGGMAKLVRMGMRGAGGGMNGFSGGLREALAEAAAERGIGRAASREASHMDDAERFAEASRGPMGADPFEGAAFNDIDELTAEVARRAALSRNDPAALDTVMQAVEQRYGREVSEEIARRISMQGGM